MRASTIAPGLCGGTEFSNVRYRGDDEAAAKVYEGSEPLTAEDVAESAYWIATLPPHVTIVSMEMLPNCQGYAGFNVKRHSAGPRSISLAYCRKKIVCRSLLKFGF